MRPSEARALRTDDIDLRRKTIRIERSADLKNTVKATKTNETRVVDLPLPESLCRKLASYVSWLSLGAMGNGQAQTNTLFPGDANGLLDESKLRKVFKWILRQANLPHFRVYDLRHSYTSALLSAGVPLLYVSKQLGHSQAYDDPQILWKWIPSEDRRYVDVLDTGLEKLGTMSWHQVDIPEKEVVEKLVGRVGVEPTAR